ncbi:hypothetical protein TREMEDRAFT_26804 [Tremella mesenterica DSM 1558]|uniref:uncharacterized protein n=1 Tax=Tremella mesenterica (strain ATCC 24925 / CBS 8224 / DSM 1558 / NBRC 9311 / NRRL Y-6157 / RJB 2259-6 / UBC 559-6) TaxID=578456 RepID=UPI0003F490EA|nr:uncharacterized protein TREMEDRAFT_26804 [Tremella mesenterica DSM 1558]EIW72295.1 hypothetical protein TREMEDRAFT_26804 [Tremella mesenterica DSM 1558]
MKKKKKKVGVEASEPTPELAEVSQPTPASPPSPEQEVTQPAPVALPVEEPISSGVATPVDIERAPTDDVDLFADMKKKKKKKKELPLDLVEAPGPAPLDGIDVPIKKKKSRKQALDFAKELDDLDGEGEDAPVPDDLDGDAGDDLFERPQESQAAESGQEAWVSEGRDPTYAELLDRFFRLLHQHNPELAGDKKRYTIVPPQVAREGTKKTVFSNIYDICRRMHRQPEHLIQFLYAELGTQGSVDGAQRLIMKGRYTQKQIENVLRKYITEYVTCKICKSPDTLLGKENRLYFMTCESCGSRLSVSAIKAGYQAQIGKRIKAA